MVSLANDFGDTGGDWTAEWRRIHLDYVDMYRLQIDTQLQLLKEHTLKLDREENVRNLQRLQDALVKLERDAEGYARKADELRNAISTFVAAVHSYRSTWTPPEETQSEWGATHTGIDDDVVDRIAAFYTKKGRDIR